MARKESGVLTEFTTRQGGSVFFPQSLPMEHHQRVELWSRFMQGNPATFNQDVFAVRSESLAHGFAYRQDTAFYDYIDEMCAKDTTIAAALDLLISFVFRWGGDFRIPKERQDDPLAQEINKRVREDLTEQSAFDFELLKWTMVEGTLKHGFSANEIVWEARNRSRHAARAYIHRHPSMFDFSPLGEPLFRSDNSGIVPMPEFKLALMRARTLYGNPFGRSLIYNLRWLYEFSREAIRAWIEACDTYGVPLGVAKVPDGTASEIVQHVDNMLASLARLTGIRLPDDVSMEFIQRSGGSGRFPHVDIIEWAMREKARTLLGSVAHFIETEYGNRATAEQAGSQTEVKIRPIAKAFDSAFTRGVLRPYLRFNWGERAVGVIEYVTHTDDGEDVEVLLKKLETAGKLNVPLGTSQVYEWLNANPPAPGEPLVVWTENRFQEWHVRQGIVSPEEVRAQAGLEGPAPATTEGAGENPAKLPVFPERRGRRDREPGQDVRLFADNEGGPESPLDRVRAARAIRNETRVEAMVRRTADLITEEELGEIKAAVAGMVSHVRQNYGWIDGTDNVFFGLEAPLTEGPADFLPLATRIIARSMILAALSTDFALSPIDGEEEPEEFADGPSWLPADLEAAVDWFRTRNVMTESELRAAVERLSRMRGSDPAAIEANLRAQALILADGISESLKQKVGQYLAAAVEQGLTVEDFLEALEESEGPLSPAEAAYWRMVFRTEMAKAYSREQEIHESHPDYADRLWGWVGWNPVDERSRPTHAALKGIYFKKGSEASRTLGRPPFSYNCRCMLVPLMIYNKRRPGYRESRNALALAREVQRW